MNLRLASITFLLLSGVPNLPAIGLASSSGGPQQKDDRKQAADKVIPNSMTGCIDQGADGKFVLIHEKSLERIANLTAEGFPTEGFAKYLGQKVTVRGTASSDGTGSTFRVRRVEVVSETCAPQQQL